MKKITLFILGVMLFSAQAGLNVKLAWTPSCDTNLFGYRIYYRTASLTNNTTTIINLDPCLNASITNLLFFVNTNAFTSNITVPGATNSAFTVSNLLPSTVYVFGIVSVSSLNLESQFPTQVRYVTPSQYTNGGRPPTLRMVPVTRSVYNLKDDLYIGTNWKVLSASNFPPVWTVFANGTNSMVDLLVTNTGVNAFFRLQIGP